MESIEVDADPIAGPSHSYGLSGPASSRSPPRVPADDEGDGAGKTKHRRTRNGCLPCRKRKKRCDEQKPTCGACARLLIECGWEDKMQAALERRRKRLERMQQRGKERIQGEAPGAHGRLPRPSPGYEPDAGPWMPHGPDAGAAASLWPTSAAGGAADGIIPYNPAQPGFLPSPGAIAASAPLQTSVPPAQSPWVPFLGSFAPTAYSAAAGSDPLAWGVASHVSAAPTLDQLANFPPSLPESFAGNPLLLDAPAPSFATPDQNESSPPFDLFALLRSPSPVHPFASSANAFDPLHLPFTLGECVSGPLFEQSPQLAISAPPEQALGAPAPPSPSQLRPRGSPSTADQPLPVAVSQAASVLASSDWAFTQMYLLTHYTNSLARLVSITSSTSSASSPRSSSSRRTASPAGAAPHDASTRASANLFLSLVPLAQHHPFLLHAICSWSAANLAAASSSSAAPSTSHASAAPAANPVMATLSDQLGHLADAGLHAALPTLQEHAAQRTSGTAASPPPSNWEAMLAARLMQTQAAICRGSVERWRVRMREAAHVVALVGGVAQCRSPLARQLVKNLLYHDVLSSSATRDGLLVDYSALSKGRVGRGDVPRRAPSDVEREGRGGAGDVAREEEDGEDDDEEEEALDTLMGAAEHVFLIIGRITNLFKDKRQAVKRGGGAIAEDELATLLAKVEEIKADLEREKQRMDAYLIERPDLEAHSYFHATFRLAALLYTEMLLEQSPRSYPVLVLVRKMLSLTEAIVSESLPGLCSMHWPLFVMHLNSTPLVCPHAAISDRERSTRLFDAHMREFTFENTKRSRALIDEAWKRSLDGRAYVDTDEILEEWGWAALSFA
ncbi:uncharacterized protein JCM10292_006008 [Rhodotorula paludigena]|uniref:uncharacterized protein n=1 Tax=Rhodotorula paludigena TaxID=86838 RepID=UPI00317316BF